MRNIKLFHAKKNIHSFYRMKTNNILIIGITIVVIGIALYCWISRRGSNTVENFDKYAQYCGNFKSRGDCRKQNHCAWINYGSDSSKFGSYCTSQESISEVSEEEEEMIQQRVEDRATTTAQEEASSSVEYSSQDYSFEGI